MYTQGQWPDNICSGKITYSGASHYGGFSLQDASHGIPTFGAVQDRKDGSTKVDIFNYPGQTEAIAQRLVACWNAHAGQSIEEIEKRQFLTIEEINNAFKKLTLEDMKEGSQKEVAKSAIRMAIDALNVVVTEKHKDYLKEKLDKELYWINEEPNLPDHQQKVIDSVEGSKEILMEIEQKESILPDDLFSHENAWRDALCIARDRPDNSHNEFADADRLYWEHEIKVFERVWKVLKLIRG